MTKIKCSLEEKLTNAISFLEEIEQEITSNNLIKAEKCLDKVPARIIENNKIIEEEKEKRKTNPNENFLFDSILEYERFRNSLVEVLKNLSL